MNRDWQVQTQEKAHGGDDDRLGDSVLFGIDIIEQCDNQKDAIGNQHRRIIIQYFKQ
jgi:hypothetical protein